MMLEPPGDDDDAELNHNSPGGRFWVLWNCKFDERAGVFV